MENTTNQFIREIDMFGKEPKLYYEGKIQKKTFIGNILSFTFIFLYCIILVYKIIRMLKKIDGTFYDTYTYQAEPPAIKLSNNNFYGGFALEHPITYDVFIDERIYYPKAYFKKAERKGKKGFEWTIKEIELEICKLENLALFFKKFLD